MRTALAAAHTWQVATGSFVASATIAASPESVRQLDTMHRKLSMHLAVVDTKLFDTLPLAVIDTKFYDSLPLATIDTRIFDVLPLAVIDTKFFDSVPLAVIDTR